MSGINPAGRPVSLWLAVTMVTLALVAGYLISYQINQRQTVENYRHMGERFGQTELVQSASPNKRPSICDSESRWLIGAQHSDDRVSAFFEGCSGLDADD